MEQVLCSHEIILVGGGERKVADIFAWIIK